MLMKHTHVLNKGDQKKKKKGTQWIISESPSSLKVGIKAH